jgi:hypothetical protein
MNRFTNMLIAYVSNRHFKHHLNGFQAGQQEFQMHVIYAGNISR